MTAREYNDPKRDPLSFQNRKSPIKTCKHGAEAACAYCNPDFFNPTKEQSALSSSISLGIKLLQAKKDYYTGKTKLTDHEYDKLEQSLRTIDPMNPALEKVGLEMDK